MLDNQLKEILENCKYIAIIGAKDKEGQPVDRVGKYLIDRGFTVYPIHPIRKNVWGLETFSHLGELAQKLEQEPHGLDIVCLFRASEYCGEHAREVLESGLKPKIFWMQEGIHSEEAGRLMYENGIKVVEDKCIKTEYERLLPLEFECKMCGICCEGKNGIIVSDKDLARLLKYFSCTEEEFLKKHGEINNKKRVLKTGDNGYCMFYNKEKGCSIHEARPDICRAWPYFRGNVVDTVSFELAKQDCKGLNPKATHKKFQQEAMKYLGDNKLFAEITDVTAGNALKFSEAEKESLSK